MSISGVDNKVDGWPYHHAGHTTLLLTLVQNPQMSTDFLNSQMAGNL